MDALPHLPAGVWRHYKGPLYLSLGYGHDANCDGRAVVVYVGLELKAAHTGPRLATRTARSDDPEDDAWWDWVHFPEGGGSKCLHPRDGTTCDFGLAVTPRFRYVSPTWEG